MPRPKYQTKWTAHENLMDLSKRRVSFKQTRGPNGMYRKPGVNVRHIDRYDDSIDLTQAPSVNVRGNNYNKYKNYGRGRNRAGSPMPQKRFYTSPCGWYRVHMPFGAKYEKAFLIEKILELLAPESLIPFLWVNEGRSTSFYIENHATAEKLFNMSKEIEMPDGFKLIIRVQADTPNIDVNQDMREKMQRAMSKRYNAEMKALDLTKFHADPELRDVLCPLFKPTVSLAAINIIAKNIPELEALSLNDNAIQVIVHLKDIAKKLPNLKVLHLARNKLKSVNHLDVLIGLPIIDLVLDGNPLCDNFKDQSAYVSEIRKRFPKLEKLDGVMLPPPIVFDVDDHKLPAGKQTFLCKEEAQSLVRQFLEQFFSYMDSDNRQPLLHAYHDNAMLSITMSYAYGQNPKTTPQLTWYNTDNRNLERVTDVERRRKLLKQGNLAVVAFLQEMPTTKHDMNSITVDVPLCTPNMVIMTVTGVYKEIRVGKKFCPIRHFFRTFVIVPNGTGFCIVNDEMHVTNATETQVAASFKTTTAASTMGSSVTSTVTSGAIAPAPSAQPDDATKHQMIQSLSQETMMKLEWAQKCLEESGWDYHRAQFAFTEAKANGAIPAHAFISAV